MLLRLLIIILPNTLYLTTHGPEFFGVKYQEIFLFQVASYLFKKVSTPEILMTTLSLLTHCLSLCLSTPLVNKSERIKCQAIQGDLHGGEGGKVPHLRLFAKWLELHM